MTTDSGKNIFLSIGAMKAGTTLLYSILKQHPDIYCLPEKELHFFAHIYGLDGRLLRPLESRAHCGFNIPRPGAALKGKILTQDFRRHRLASVMRGQYSAMSDANELREITCWYAERYLTDPIDWEWFERIFVNAGHRYCADFSNYGALLGKRAWREIKQAAKGRLKVLYIMRHPAERLWSHYKFHQLHAGNTFTPEAFNAAQVDKLAKDKYISAHSRYGDIIQDLTVHLNENNLKIIFFEDLLRSPGATLRSIETFLGVPAHSYSLDLTKKINASSPILLNPSARERMHHYMHPQLHKMEALGINVPGEYFI